LFRTSLRKGSLESAAGTRKKKPWRYDDGSPGGRRRESTARQHFQFNTLNSSGQAKLAVR
jgi:hypothetical protein